jgi:UMF1 family MFS transporter
VTAQAGLLGARANVVDDTREIVGWSFYDWANSAFPTTVGTVFLGPYLTSVTKAAADPTGFVHPLGIAIAAGSFFPFLISIAVLLQLATLPILGAIADYSRRKKQLLAVFAYLGAAATAGLYFVAGTNYLLGALLFLVANTSFGASVVFYNAFLPEIASAQRRDYVSSLGWAIGYLGGGILLAANLVLVFRADALGLTTADAARVSLASAGAWWAIFTIIPLAAIRSREPIKLLPEGASYLTIGFRQLRATLSRARALPHTLLFLVAYLIYADGIQTVITLSSQFGQEELGLPISTLTAVILMVQFVAFGGTLVVGWIARRIGTKRTVLATLALWIAILAYAYGFLYTATQFWILGAAIAIVLGGTQALSRSLYSLMIPRGQAAEYFSLYEVSDKGTSWLGPLLFGLALQFTGSYRIAIVSIVVFFIAGMALLSRVNVREAAREAGNEAPAGV